MSVTQFKTEVMQANSLGIQTAATILANGGVVAIPTETVYGLAANAFDSGAIAKIFTAKERPLFDPLIVHVAPEFASIAALAAAEIIDSKPLSQNASILCEKLMAEFWPGPLTILLPKGKKIPDLVTAGLPMVGIRAPAHRAAKRLLIDLKLPLAAPSANRFGRISPTSAEHVLAELSGRIPLILDGGISAVGVESTVILIEPDRIAILRPGGVSMDELRRIAGNGPIIENTSGVDGTGSAMIAPGNTASHYAPSVPVIVWSGFLTKIQNELQAAFESSKKIALLFSNGDPIERLRELPGPLLQKSLSASLSRDGNPEEAARNLFSMLRKFDDSDVQVIFAELPAQEFGLWPAIKDRLVRAAGKK